MEALLIDFGHPLEVAARYSKVQYLIGPEVYPYWWAAVKVMLSIVAGIYLVLIAIASLAQETPAQFDRAVPSIWYVVVYLFGMITLAFMGFERFGKTAFLRRWRPSRLAPATGKTRSRFELAAEMTMDVIFLLWWLGLIRFRDMFPMPDFLTVDLAPVWMAWKWPIVGYALLEIVADLAAMVQPGQVRINVAVSIARYAWGAVVLSQIIQAGHWLIVRAPSLSAQVVASMQPNFDLGMRIGIGVTIAAMLFRIGQELWRLRQLRLAELSGYRAA